MQTFDDRLDTAVLQLQSALRYVEMARAEQFTVPKYDPTYQAINLIKSAEKTLRNALREVHKAARK